MLDMGMVALFLLLVAMAVGINFWIRPQNNRVLLRTGWGGVKLSKHYGFICLPYFHQVQDLSLEVHSLELKARAAKALRTQDWLKVNVTLIINLRILDTSEALVKALPLVEQGIEHWLQTWWEKAGRGLLDTVLATDTLERWHQSKATLLTTVQNLLEQELSIYGIEVLSMVISEFEAAPIEHYNPQDYSDAKGLVLLAALQQELISQRKQQLQFSRRQSFEESLQFMQWEKQEFAKRLELIRFKAEADAKTEQELAEIETAKLMALEMLQHDLVMQRRQTQQALEMA